MNESGHHEDMNDVCTLSVAVWKSLMSSDCKRQIYNVMNLVSQSRSLYCLTKTNIF